MSEQASEGAEAAQHFLADEQQGSLGAVHAHAIPNGRDDGTVNHDFRLAGHQMCVAFRENAIAPDQANDPAIPWPRPPKDEQ